MKQSLKKTLFVILLISVVFIGIYFYFFKNDYTDKYPEIPFFPDITNSNEFENSVIDSIIVKDIIPLKKEKRIIITYRNDTISNDSISLAIVTDKMKTIYHSKFGDVIYNSLNDKNNKLFIVNKIYHSENGDFDSKINECQVINVFNGNKINLKELDKTLYSKIKKELSIIKHFSPNNYTKVIFFEDTEKNIFFATNDLAKTISESIELDENLNFNFEVEVMLGGDPKIKNTNILMFDKIVTDEKFKVNISLDLNSNSSEASEIAHKENEGYKKGMNWFETDQLYYFKMTLKNSEVKFKSDLYYYSDFYFIELNEIKTESDTLFYYCENKIYSFNKK
jgi:hypothetical protein